MTLRHDDGTTTLYAHVSSESVNIGDVVSRGADGAQPDRLPVTTMCSIGQTSER